MEISSLKALTVGMYVHVMAVEVEVGVESGR